MKEMSKEDVISLLDYCEGSERLSIKSRTTYVLQQPYLEVTISVALDDILCEVNNLFSGVCNRGTHGCKIVHE